MTDAIAATTATESVALAPQPAVGAAQAPLDVVAANPSPPAAAGQVADEVVAYNPILPVSAMQLITEVLIHPNYAMAGQLMTEVVCQVTPTLPVVLTLTADTVGVLGDDLTMLFPSRMLSTAPFTDANTRGLIYTLTTPPAHGEILLNAGPGAIWTPTTSWTQHDIDGGYLAYRHTADTLTPDRFAFTVTYPVALTAAGALDVIVLLNKADPEPAAPGDAPPVFGVTPDNAEFAVVPDASVFYVRTPC